MAVPPDLGRVVADLLPDIYPWKKHSSYLREILLQGK